MLRLGRDVLDKGKSENTIIKMQHIKTGEHIYINEGTGNLAFVKMRCFLFQRYKKKREEE